MGSFENAAFAPSFFERFDQDFCLDLSWHNTDIIHVAEDNPAGAHGDVAEFDHAAEVHHLPPSFLAFLIIAVRNAFYRWPDEWWANWWLFNIIFGGVTGVIATAWFLIGGFRDLGRLFRRLATIQRDAEDDGTVKKEECFGN